MDSSISKKMEENVGAIAKSVQHNNANYLVFARNETAVYDD